MSGSKYDQYNVWIARRVRLPDGQYQEVQNPYRTVDGRIAEARDTLGEAGKQYAVMTYANMGEEHITIDAYSITGQRFPIVVPPHHTVAVVSVSDGSVYMGTALHEGVRGTDEYVVETAETSAVGRALAFAGYGLIPHAGIASADEMARVPDVGVAPAPAKPAPAAAKPTPPPGKPTTPGAKSAVQPAPAAARKPAPGQPGAYVIAAGKHKGKTIAQVYAEEPDYIRWLSGVAEPSAVLADAKDAAAAFIAEQLAAAEAGKTAGAVAKQVVSKMQADASERDQFLEDCAFLGLNGEQMQAILDEAGGDYGKAREALSRRVDAGQL